MKNFWYFIAVHWLLPTVFSASTDVYPDRWCINSPGLSIEWGQAGNDRYISIIDPRTPKNSLLILPDDIEAKSKAAFDALHNERVNSIEAGAVEGMENSLKTLPSVSKQKPVEDDTLVMALSEGTGLIWTGAGISSISGIPTLLELYNTLGLRSIPFTHMVEEYNLRQMATRIYSFKMREIMFNFLSGVFKKSKHEPSPAHFAVKDILKLTGSHYITSNLDHLEDDLGYGETVTFEAGDSVDTAILKTRSTNTEFTPNWILIVDLRIDDYGIAEWAAHKNIPIYYVGPNPPELASMLSGKISLTPVMWVKADAQSYLPALLQALKIKKVRVADKS